MRHYKYINTRESKVDTIRDKQKIRNNTRFEKVLPIYLSQLLENSVEYTKCEI